ncbi:Arylsulfatase [Streptomyces sp. ADI91-18]|nr:Arylsulfatase [Streptomyces sp. ADI91-18]
MGAAAAAVGLGSGPAAASEAPREGRSERPFRAARERRSRRPNILFILGDDLGWADLSSYGSPHIKTPNLDRLARQGVRFTDAYAGSATCSPTRFSLYTGRYPGRTEGGLAEPIADRSAGLEPTHPTLASLLRDAGYATALIGKWHAGYLPDYSPTRSGWEEFFGNFGGALEYYSKLGLGGEYDLYEGDAEYKDLRWPARIDGGQVSHVPVFSPDWTATLLELAGTRADRAYPLDGASLAGYLLRGEKAAERDLFWRVRGERALRRGDWKYYRGKTGRDQLFNLAGDLREQADRAAAEPDRLARLRAAWEQTDAGLLPYPA